MGKPLIFPSVAERASGVLQYRRPNSNSYLSLTLILLVIHSNYVPIWHRWDIVRYWSKIADFHIIERMGQNQRRRVFLLFRQVATLEAKFASPTASCCASDSFEFRFPRSRVSYSRRNCIC